MKKNKQNKNSIKTLKQWNQNRNIGKHSQNKTETTSIGSYSEDIGLDFDANITQQNYVLNMQHKNW